MDQRHIIVNNLAIRRATEELSNADDLGSICAVLNAAFEDNEFDAFLVTIRPLGTRYARIPAIFGPSFDGTYRYGWQKRGIQTEPLAKWQLTFSLRGPLSGQEAAFTVYRYEVTRSLLFDINMLTGEFQTVLSEALERALTSRVPEPLLANVALANAGLAAMSD